jgi:hypothetical protein
MAPAFPGLLNKVEEHVKEGGAFKPQFVGSSGLTAKLDFTSMSSGDKKEDFGDFQEGK